MYTSADWKRGKKSLDVTDPLRAGKNGGKVEGGKGSCEELKDPSTAQQIALALFVFMFFKGLKISH